MNDDERAMLDQLTSDHFLTVERVALAGPRLGVAYSITVTVSNEEEPDDPGEQLMVFTGATTPGQGVFVPFAMVLSADMVREVHRQFSSVVADWDAGESANLTLGDVLAREMSTDLEGDAT